MVSLSLQSLLFEEPESGPNAIFGKYLFDKTRGDVPLKKQENETPVEIQFRKALAKYIRSNTKKYLEDMIPGIINRTSPESLYRHILKPDSVTVYRTLNVTANAVGGILPLDVETLRAQKVGSIANTILQPTPGNEIQGWTTERAFGKVWLNQNSGNKFLGICAKTSTDKGTFFGAPGELAKASGNIDFVAEMETISYGPVFCDEIRFFTEEFHSSHPKLQQKIRDYVSFATDVRPA